MKTVDDMVRAEVICCVSGLVSDLAKILPHVPGKILRETSFDDDELTDLMGQDDWEDPAEWHVRHGLTQEELTDLLTEKGYDELPDSAGACADLLLQHLKDADEWQKFASDHNLDPHYIEVYEHWVVSDWFAARLKEKGQVIGDLGNLTIWGRTTTGQMISMDWVVQQIHKEMMA